jgi:hypothetical protein
VDEVGGRGRPFEQLRPQQVVLARVVQVEAAQDEAGVPGHDAGPGGVAWRYFANELGDQPELAAEAAVDDKHVADVGELLCGSWCGSSHADKAVAECCCGDSHRAPTLPPRSALWGRVRW